MELGQGSGWITAGGRERGQPRVDVVANLL
jgi:hypothetical protein